MKKFSGLGMWAAFALTTATTAHAQISSESLEIELSREVAIGIDNCESGLEEQFQLTGTLSGIAALEYELRLTYSDTSQPCTWAELPNCPQNKMVNDQRCGCILSSESSPLNRTISLSDLDAIVCAEIQPGESEFNFFLEYEDQSDEAADTIASSPVSVRIDFERPGAPAAAPQVSSAESALEVSFAASDDGDVSRYEVCARANPAAIDEGEGLGALTGALTNDDLRDGFEEGDCQRTNATSIRFTGLENGISYAVVYAAIDEAGNRGANSPTASGTPAGVLDFAEIYHSQGGTEPGGCAAGDAGVTSLLSLLVLGALRRRRAA